MRKRAVFAHWLERAGILNAISRLRARAPSPWLTVLTYHSIRPNPGPFDDGVVDASVALFDRQMEMIRGLGTPVTLSELREAIQENRPLPRRPLLVTFDDGYRDNFELALPILLRHRIRATFFVATGYVENRRLFWWDKLAYLIARSRRSRIELDYPRPVEIDLRDRAKANGTLQRIVKATPDLDLERFLYALGDAAEVELSHADERRFADELILTWKQVRALHEAGMDVQSHTRNHRVLQTLPRRELEDELRGSRQELEDVLKTSVFAVSYPVGRTIADSPALREAIASAGYELGFSNASGVNNLWQAVDPLDLRRISLDRDVDEVLFRGMLALPPLGLR